MNKKKDTPILLRISPFLGIAAFVFALAVVIYCGVTGNHENTRFASQHSAIEAKVTSDPWGSNVVGDNYQGIIGRTEHIYVTVPNVSGTDYYMMFKSAYCRCEVYDDSSNTLIGSYAERPPHPFGEMTGNIRVLVPINEIYSGNTLRIDISTYYDTTVDYPDVIFGSLGTLKLRVIRDNILRFAICLILITLIVLATAVAIFEYIVGAREITGMFFDFISFVLCILTWMVCSSDIPQFITNNNENVSLISFLSLSIMSIPFAAFCLRVMSYGKKVFDVITKVGWLLPVTICVCYVTNICDPFHILILTHIELVFTLFMAIICSVKQKKEDKGAKILFLSLITLALFAAVGLACFYYSKTGGYDAIFFGGGLAIFIMMLFALLIHRQMGYYEKKKEAELYKYMAYTDLLTGIPNRTAYEDKLYELMSSPERRYVAFFIFDLNNLKLFNDQYGHQEGDKAIKATASCIEKAFAGKGFYFRLGGDEFAALVIGNENQSPQCSAEFKHQIEVYNMTAEHKISVAAGWAEDYQNEDSQFFRKLFTKADGDMYAEKQRMKAEYMVVL